jgi:hypothetical protein
VTRLGEAAGWTVASALAVWVSCGHADKDSVAATQPITSVCFAFRGLMRRLQFSPA